MNTAQFDKVVEHRLAECKRILIEKAKEYAKGDDDLLRINVTVNYLFNYAFN